VFDTGVVLENEFEVGGRAFLDKIDRDIWENILSLLFNSFRAIYTLQVNISVGVGISTLLNSKSWIQD
jgi:hypothetical protein